MANFSLAEFFRLGGIFMWPLLAFSIVGLAFIIERIYVFSKSSFGITPEINSFFEKIKSKEIEEAKNILNRDKNNFISEVLLSGLSMLNQDIHRIEKSMETAINIKVKHLEKRLNGMIVLSNIAPLTGFLGTVSGMINSFKSIATAEEVSTQLVATGIYEALITTVVGLIIAIFIVTAHSIFLHKIDSFINEAERLSNEFVEILIEKNIK